MLIFDTTEELAEIVEKERRPVVLIEVTGGIAGISGYSPDCLVIVYDHDNAYWEASDAFEKPGKPLYLPDWSDGGPVDHAEIARMLRHAAGEHPPRKDE